MVDSDHGRRMGPGVLTRGIRHGQMDRLAGGDEHEHQEHRDHARTAGAS